MTTGILWLTTQSLTLAKISSDEYHTCICCYIIRYSMFYCHLTYIQEYGGYPESIYHTT